MSAPHPPTADGHSILILAGSRGGIDPVAEACGKSAKAFAEIDGTPMIERVLATLIASDLFSDITVSLPDGLPIARESPQLDRWLNSGRVSLVTSACSPSASVLQSLHATGPDRRLVVTTADHPLLSVDSLTEFVAAFTASDAGAVAALTSTDAIRARYPEMRRTALRFRNGNFSGCNLFGFAGSAGLPVVQFWRQLEQHRKSPLRVVAALGLGTLLRYRFGRLTLDAALDRLGRKTGVKLQAIHLDDPHMGIDVDSPEDLTAVTKILSTR